MLLVIGLASSALGQDFKVYPSYIGSSEGGRHSILMVEMDGAQFSIGSPKLYGSQVFPDTRTIVFTSTLVASVMTVHFTTNYPGKLPEQDQLRDEVAAKYPTASLVSSSSCFTDFGQGQCFELFLPTGDGLMLRMRDAYVSHPAGSVEFTFSCNGADYDKQKLFFSRLLNSFQRVKESAKRNL